MVKQKIITTLIFLFIFKIQFINCQPPRCLSYQSEQFYDEMDKSWYLYQLPQENGVYYWNSLYPKSVDLKPTALRLDKTSPFIRTFKQLTAKDSDLKYLYNYVTYNDQPAGGKQFQTKFDDPEGGHSKGVFIWNENGGIHLMHSYPRFPNYRTSTMNGNLIPNVEQKLEKGQFEWFTTDRPNVIKDLEAFNHDEKSGGPKQSIYQHAQYAYCRQITTEQINKGYIYKHLVLTNSIIGLVNGLELRISLSDLEAIDLPKDLNQVLFPRVNLFRSTIFESTFEKESGKIYNDEDITESKITNAIFSDIAKYSSVANKKFPLFILAKHAYYFSVYARKQFLQSVDLQTTKFKDLNEIYFYQREYYEPWITRVGASKSTFTKHYKRQGYVIPSTVVWSYMTGLKVNTDDVSEISLMGNLFLQTQHVAKNKVLEITNHHIYAVNVLKFENSPFANRENDHAKQAFSVTQPITDIPPVANAVEYNWFCVGDNNFVETQKWRGGSVYCFKNSVLSKFFSEKVASYSYKSELTGVLQTITLNEPIKQFVNSILLHNIGKFYNSIPFYTLKNDGKFLYPPPKTIDLWAEYQDGIKFKSPKATIVDDTTLSFKDPIRFCWSSADYYKSFIQISNSEDCGVDDCYKTQYLCTVEKIPFSIKSTYKVSSLNEKITFKMVNDPVYSFSLGPFQNQLIQVLIMETIMIDIGSFYYKDNLNVVVNPKLRGLPYHTHKDDVLSFCKDGRKRYLYGNCLDLFLYCVFFENHIPISENNNFYTFMNEIIETIGLDKSQIPSLIQQFDCGFDLDIDLPNWNTIIQELNRQSLKEYKTVTYVFI